MVRVVTGSLRSCIGKDLYTVEYLPDEVPRAVLCYHHGLQEHIGRYDDIFKTMADAGIAVISFDAIGHGKSGGERGYIPKFNNLIDDFEAVCTAAAGSEPLVSYPPLPYFIGGHSMGGLVATLTCLRNQSRWAGLLISAPALDMEWTPALRAQALISNLLTRLIPKARIVSAIDPADLNRDPQKCQAYVDDPLNTVGPLYVRTGNEGLQAMKGLRQRWTEVTLPVYAHHGTKDKIVAYSVTK